jgi:hypothetical protein
MMMRLSAPQFAASITGTTVWVVAVLLGIMWLVRHEMKAGPRAAVAAQWPAAAGVVVGSTRPTLVMALHPQCPCSRASLHELANILAHARGKVSVKILFVEPDGANDAWVRSDLWHQAQAMPGVTISIDKMGREAAAFGATTSGEVLLYNTKGRLLFSGGITYGRGHEGENAGTDAILAILNNDQPATRSSPVFGCSLMGDTCLNEGPQTKKVP